MAGESSSPAHVGLAAGIVGQTGLEQVHQPAVPKPLPGISSEIQFVFHNPSDYIFFP